MAESKKLPAIQFYPGDWRKDPCVQALDYEHRGIWVETLFLMHEGTRRGYLTLPSGEPMPDEAIARNLGLPLKAWQSARKKLLVLGVASENDDGALYSRRMVRDEKTRRAKARAGRKGGAVSGVARRKSRQRREITSEAKPKQKRSKREAKGQAKKGSSVSVSVSVSASAEKAKYHPPSASNSAGHASDASAGEDRERTQETLLERTALEIARRNIIAIHGGTEDDIEIEGHRVGVGIEVNAYKALVDSGIDPPEIIAAAIGFLPEITGLTPPVSLARWRAADGAAVYARCAAKAYAAFGRNGEHGVRAKTIPAADHVDPALEARKRMLREQAETLKRAEASP